MLDVLILEDFEDSAEALARYARLYKCAAEHYATVAEGERVVYRNPPKVLFADLRLPGNGTEDFIAKVRRDFPACRIVVWSAFLTEEIKDRLRAIGVTDFLAKPPEGGLEEIRQLLPVPEEGRDG